MGNSNSMEKLFNHLDHVIPERFSSMRNRVFEEQFVLEVLNWLEKNKYIVVLERLLLTSKIKNTLRL